jgi:ATP-binding cassette subfamily C (CFTR/MRP) protein 1
MSSFKARLLTCLVHHLPLADNILLLGERKILAQGSFQQLKKLDMTSKLLERLEISDRSSENVDAPQTSTGKKASDDTAIMLGAEDLTRKTGEWSVYKYYIQAAGPVHCIGFTAVSIATAFCYNFPSKTTLFDSSKDTKNYVVALWLKLWSDASESGNNNIALYLPIYFLFAILSIIALLLACQ